VLLIGTLLARGRRTVTAALRQMGLREASNFSLYHHVRNRAHWSALALSRRRRWRWVRTCVAMGGASIVPRHVARQPDAPTPLLSRHAAHLHG